MADIRRIVTLDSSGSPTTVQDVNSTSTTYAKKGTWRVNPPASSTVMAQRARPYGGGVASYATHDNGTIGWTAQVKAANATAALSAAESLFQVLRQPRLDLYLQWQPDGATNSTYYAIRGPANITPSYDWAAFAMAQIWSVDIEIPVAPLAQAAPSTVSISSSTFPAVVNLGTIPGSAPAVADVTLRTGNGTGAAPVWAMIGWAIHPGTPLASSSAPFGFLEAESGTLTTFASTADANARGGNLAQVTTSGAGTAAAVYALDPSVLFVDDYALSDVDVEVWARVKITNTVVSPKLVTNLEPFAGTAYGNAQYTSDTGGASGKLLTLPTSGTVYRIVKLGTLSMPVDKVTPLKWNLRVAASWAAGSSGAFGLDYLWFVPARARALGATGKPNDSTYPDFIGSNADTTKKIRGSDLAGFVGSAAGNLGRDSGLGGSPIELPAGQNVDMLIKLSSLVPDDPTVDTTTEQLSHTVSGSVVITPRYYLVRGS